jgi:hypothetical protein
MREWQPEPRHSGPLVVLAGCGAVVCGWMGFNLAVVRNGPGAVIFATLACILPLAVWAYFRNARIVVAADWVGKRDIVGRLTRCPIAQLRGLETRYFPQPSVCFVRTDGTVAFRVNRRLWKDDQVSEITRCLGELIGAGPPS